MERQARFTDSPNHLSSDSPSPALVYFCSLCNKPFINGRESCGIYVSSSSYLTLGAESSRHRHIRYCGTRSRNRPRSCHACNAAKTKCNFETPCSRCVKKSIECVYNAATAVGRQTLPTSSEVASFGLADDEILNNANDAFTDHLAMNDARLQFVTGNSHPSTQTFSLNESLTLDRLLVLEDYASDQLQRFSDVSVAPWDKGNQQPAAWCTWTRGGFSLSVVTETPVGELNSNLLAILQTERPHAQHNANLVIQSLRSFPTMMLRRETFPWFIHPHSQLLSNPGRADLPEALSTCMCIAQMFVLRTSETSRFLWCTVRAESRRFINEVCIPPKPCSSHSDHQKKHHMSTYKLLASLQAGMVYLIMCIIDQSPEGEGASLEILIALHAGS